ncbi:hypothetical protein ACHAWC_004138 [Mediolabrus comicus]
MDIVHAQLAQIRRRLGGIPALQKLEEKANVPKEYAVLGAVLSLFLFIEDGVLCNVIGFIYPAIKSFQALENRVGSEVTTQWIIYWVIYSFFSIIEVFIDVLLYFIPTYYPFKVAFLLWAMMPQLQGAKFFYDCFLKDFLKKNESKIDAESENATTSAGEVAVEATGAAEEVASAVTSSLMNISQYDALDATTSAGEVAVEAAVEATGAAEEVASALAISSLMNISQYDALAAAVKVKDITSCARNRALVHRIKNNDPSLLNLSISSTLDPDAGEEFFDLILGEGDDLGWLGYHIGSNKVLKTLYISLSEDGEQTSAFFNGLQRNESIKSIDLCSEVTLNEGFLKMNFPRITKIGLHGRHFRQGLLYFARGLSKCRSLTAYGGIVTTEIAATLMSLPMLEEIRVSMGDGEDSVQETCVELGKLVQNRKLKRLYLTGCGIGNEGLSLLAEKLALAEGAVLDNLSLSSNNIGDEGVVALVKSFSQNPSLRILSLSLVHNTSITENGMRAISQLLQSQKCSLDNLNLGGINIRGEGMKFLSCGLFGNKSLVSLRLSHWNEEMSIDNDDIRVLTAGLKRNSHLRELDLSGNREITTAGIIYLGDYLHSPASTLETLKIYGVRFGDEGAHALAEALGGNTSLKRLLFDDAGVTVTGWLAFSTLANKSSPTSVYHSNHTLCQIGHEWSWTSKPDVSRWLDRNKNGKNWKLVVKSKILDCFSDLDMVPLFDWDLKLLPFVKAWFGTVTSRNDARRAYIRNGELSAIYKFVRGMPVYVANENKQHYLSCQLKRIQAAKTKLRKKMRALSAEMKMLSAEMNSVEERERRLVQV